MIAVDEAEIEKNKKLIKQGLRIGANAGNNNPKLKKKWRFLNWYFDRVEPMVEQLANEHQLKSGS